MTITTSQPRPAWLSGRPDHIPSMPCCPPEAGPITDQEVAAARERLRGASLAYTDQPVTAEPPLICPRAGQKVILELYSGVAFPDRCRANGCPYCLPINARRRALAITLAAPERMIRLSWVARSHEEDVCDMASIRIKRTRQALRRMGLDPGEWCWTIEKNPKETGYHAHCLQVGGFIPQDLLQEGCRRGGAGFPDIRYIRRKGIWTSRYGLKGFGADGYGLKSFRPNGNAAEALAINNGRLEHHTPSFYMLDGEVLKVRDMERAAVAALNADNPKAFLAVRREDVERVIADLDLRHRLIVDVNQRSVNAMRAFR